MRNCTYLLVMGLALPAPAAAPVEAGAPGRLSLFPHRVILDDALPKAKGFPQNRGRSAEVTLINGGRERATYRISFMNMDMDEDGRLYQRPRAPGEITAEDLIRYSPRQVVLEPGIAQTVRIQIRMREGLPAGEYRSHMMFRAVPSVEQPPIQNDGTPPDPGGEPGEQQVSMDLKIIYGLSVPIVFRHGATHASVGFSDLRLRRPARNDAPPELHCQINRTGNRSVYGELETTWTPRGGLPRAVGAKVARAIYARLPRVKVALPLADLPPGPGTLKLRYADAETGKLLAEAALEVHRDG
jgi:hypothetical protein